MNSNTAFVTALVAVVIAIGAFLFPRPAVVPTPDFGGMSNLDGLTIVPVDSTDGFKLGTNGTLTTRVNTGYCTIVAYANTIAASSSALVDCLSSTAGSVTGGLSALTGVQTGDAITASLSTSTSSLYGGLAISQVSASTTAGVIQLRIANLTGGTFTWSAAASTTAVAYTAIDF